MKYKYCFITFVLWLLAQLPLPLLHLLGWLLGECVYWLRAKIRRTAAINIDFCFPEKTQSYKDKLLKKFLHNKGKEVLEIPAIFLRSRKSLQQLITKVIGSDNVLQCISKQQPVIFLNAHFGSFILGSALEEFDAAWLSQTQPGIIEYLIQKRVKNFNIERIPTTASGIKRLSGCLSSSKPIGVFIDHDPVEGGKVLSSFFSKSAFTSTLASKLIGKHNARVFFFILVRKAKGSTFQLHFIPANDEIHSTNVEGSCQAINDQLECIIRQFPEQYDWGYERFRRANRDLYKKPSANKKLD